MRRAQAPAALAPQGPSVHPKTSSRGLGSCAQHMRSACGAHSRKSVRLLAALRSSMFSGFRSCAHITRIQHTTAPARALINAEVSLLS